MQSSQTTAHNFSTDTDHVFKIAWMYAAKNRSNGLYSENRCLHRSRLWSNDKRKLLTWMTQNPCRMRKFQLNHYYYSFCCLLADRYVCVYSFVCWKISVCLKRIRFVVCLVYTPKQQQQTGRRCHSHFLFIEWLQINDNAL